MIPIIAIVGRPNVGKSTLFNVLTQTRNALVLDAPGVTRDRQYGEGEFEQHKFIVIDTGGLTTDPNLIESQMETQSLKAAEEADCLFFIVDGRAGKTPEDEKIAARLRKFSKPIYVLVNKTEGLDPNLALSDFYALGLPNLFPIAASHKEGIYEVLELAFRDFSKETETEPAHPEEGIKIAFVGKPNVGKSTLVNRLLKEDRMIVMDEAGTTRDSIYIPLKRLDESYTLIDTAGVRRRSRVLEAVEKFSVVKTLQAIEAANVVVLLMDAREGITDQDLGLLGFIVETGRALVIALNKWDDLSPEQRQEIKKQAAYRLNFVAYARVHWISALQGSGLSVLFDSIKEAYASSKKEISTSEVNRILEKAQLNHPPPMIRGRRIKLRYGHVGGHQPPLIVIHGNQTESLPQSYRKYLSNTFRKALDLWGTPIRLEFKTSKNPYSERKPISNSKYRDRRPRQKKDD